MLALLLALVFAQSAFAVTRPWLWTPAQTAAALLTENNQHVTCRGVGKSAWGRYIAFRCGTLMVTVRRSHPDVCFTAQCLRASSAVQGTVDDAKLALRRAMSARFTPDSPIKTWQTFQHWGCAGSGGVYDCVFDSAVTGTARIVFLTAGPRVTFLTLTCAEAFAGRPGCQT